MWLVIMRRSWSAFVLVGVVLLFAGCQTHPPPDPDPEPEPLAMPTYVTVTPAPAGVVVGWRFDGDIEAGLTFELERAVDGGDFATLASLSGSARSYLDSSVVVGVEYAYRVRAVVGSVSALSDVGIYASERMDVGVDELAFAGSVSSQTGFGVPGELLRAGALMSASVSTEPREPVDRVVIGPVARLSVARTDLRLDSSEPLLVLLPALAGFELGERDVVSALVRIVGASGEVAEFVAQYTMNVTPVRVDMWMLRAVEEEYGLPETVEIEVVPLFSAAPSSPRIAVVEALSAPALAVGPWIEHLSGLHRLDVTTTPTRMAAACGDGVAVSSFDEVRTAFGATLVEDASQSAWTQDLGKRPLLLVHGVQSFPHAKFDMKGEDAFLAAGLCAWQEFVRAFNTHPSLAESYTLYVFGYDSVMNRIASNAVEFRRQLEGAFGDVPAYVIAHSMGGMVTRAAMEDGANVARLYSLGTPYRGSAGSECTRATSTQCDIAIPTISYGVLDLLQQAVVAEATWMLQYPGVRDLTFETAFRTHRTSECAFIGRFRCEEADNVANPYLATLNAGGVSRPESITAFVGNIVEADRTFDNTFGYRYRDSGASALTSSAISKQLGRFNDNIVSVGSGAFLDLHVELGLSYSELGSLVERSPFDEVVLAPCLDHSLLKGEEFELLRAPWGSSCAQADAYPGGGTTVFGWIATDLMRRVGGTLPPGDGILVASVLDAVTAVPIDDVMIGVCPAGGGCYSAFVDHGSDGLYRFTLPAGSGYAITFRKLGYLDATYANVAVAAGETTFLQQLLLIDEAYDVPAGASGRITDAFSGGGVAGAELWLRVGFGSTTGPVVATATTDSVGEFAFSSLDAGYYAAQVTRSGYVTATFSITVVGGQANASQNFSISPELAEDEVRIVLTWGAAPRDLDSFLTGPRADDASERFRIAFFSRAYSHDGITYAQLDHDVMSGYGPETISIYEQIPGVYRYSVHDYTNRDATYSMALANSGAQVRVYRGATLVREFNVPSAGGTLWTVFELDGAALTPVNVMSYESGNLNIESVGNATEGGLLRSLPPK